MKKNYPRALWWLTVATFLVPLIVLPSYFIFPFIVPKVLVFRTLVLCQLGVFLLWYFSKQTTVRISRTPISIAVLFFFASFTLSTFFGTDWYHSFWDNHERMLGLFTIAHYVLYYFIITTTFKEMDTWRRLLLYFVMAASVVLAIALWQKIQPNFLLNNNNGRTSATLGNAIYLGGYCVWLFFVSCYLAVTDTLVWRRWLLGCLAVLAILGIIASGTRGSVLGLVVGLVILFIVYFCILPKEKQRERRIIGVGGAVAVLGFLVLFAFRTTSLVAHIPAVGSLLNTNFIAGTASTRIMAWKIAWQATEDHPLFGWGPNNFVYAFNKYYNPRFLEHGWGETWFDNAHNIIMNTLTTQGFVGLLAYLSLFGATFWQLFRAFKKNHLSVHLVALSSGFLVAHLVQNIFVFENITSYLFFFFYLAFINSITHSTDKLATNETMFRSVFGGVTRVAIWVMVILSIWVTNISPARANMAMIDVFRTIYTQGDVVAAYNGVLAISSPHHDDNRMDMARLITQSASEYLRIGKKVEAQRLLNLAISELDKNRLLHPNDIRNHIQEAQLLQITFDVSKNPDYLFKAERLLEEAQVFSPARQQIQYVLSILKSMLGKHNEAIAILRKSVADSPTIPEGWWRLAYILQNAKKIEEAQNVVREARAQGILFIGVGENVVNEILPLPVSPTSTTGTKTK
ncbi:MAG: hypothetical protein A2821_02895 [Candidatus Magasanikbacteria bacterium RIFCSPHIGHO2_01_FULL_41_23]|uniref:O-antigen ligase-related domain-containing protein n=1 Tax=Candidatus Magasanikbacteria bacterium RIFCSPLOWO2_01_FULL_40_15 TaxID=1798686 RepID=A0A1F6N3Q7_9BACT|nr:MAG: hypothetical protein A2821_02895 [Candidatus Magasanikbacteria bacterium RIFCSPHIGHO2_01_FULL_41_23]OGH67285.1 MAG: hypothetical protein A3C66_00910 [Candidatus Magasanikbacteria bacterium RIFCSPHIGHO2_02_FULL_41_35]OGH76510.1 MAG: hypothetical protein A3F22_00120 [Candidatus Magasanikbacteria bacterium RIFCSPHIGHO2_12_FULL_41_16]OGH78504.1 MAG: hypothetical protein A2983_03235 [Candidatus Magasanikbacteria bacterium RIFCSPLOWO2_01_FULL_40_15]